MKCQHYKVKIRGDTARLKVAVNRIIDTIRELRQNLNDIGVVIQENTGITDKIKPAESVQDYKSAQNWSNYAPVIFAI